MTVLQRRDARGFETGPIRKFVVGAAVAVVGVGAAFGLSQVIDQEETSAMVTTPAESNAIAQGQAQRAESMERLDQALIEKYRPAATLSPAAIEHARGLDVLEQYNELGASTPAAIEQVSGSQSGPR